MMGSSSAVQQQRRQIACPSYDGFLPPSLSETARSWLTQPSDFPPSSLAQPYPLLSEPAEESLAKVPVTFEPRTSRSEEFAFAIFFCYGRRAVTLYQLRLPRQEICGTLVSLY